MIDSIQLLLEPAATAGLRAPLTLGAGLVLVSWWKPALLLLPFLGWGWLVSRVLDKHAKRFFLGQEKWALIHMLFAAAGLGVIVLLPMQGTSAFFIAVLLIVVLLAADIGLFVGVANRDERVPEHQHLKIDMASIQKARQAKKDAKQQGTVQLQIRGPSKVTFEPPPKDAPEYAVRVAAEEMVVNAVRARASQVDLAPAGQGTYALSMLIDGVRQAGEPIPAANAIQIIDFWKGCAELDVEDRRRKQSGIAEASNEAMNLKVKVVTSGSQSGMQMTAVFNPGDAVRRAAEDLGMLESQLAAVREMASSNTGVVLLAAPKDSGRTTSLYSVINLHDAYTSNVQTIEMEPEDSVEGVRQVTFDQSTDAPELATQVRSMLRRDPDVVGVADLPDAATAQEIAKCDFERTRVYVSMRADGALAAVQLWVKAVGDPKEASNGLTGVVAQKLVRTLCENCKVAYPPPADLLKKLGLPVDKVKQLFKKGGQVLIRNKPDICPVCQGIGYVGQAGVFEVYTIGAEEQQLVASQNWATLRNQFRKSKQPTIQQSALRKALEGTTSIEEVMRVTAPPAKKPPSGGSTKPKSEKPAPVA